MAYNHGREERKWRIWKENEEKILRECGLDESTIEEIRTYDRAVFNSNRRFLIPTGGFTDGQMMWRSTLKTWQTRRNKQR